MSGIVISKADMENKAGQLKSLIANLRQNMDAYKQGINKDQDATESQRLEYMNLEILFQRAEATLNLYQTHQSEQAGTDNTFTPSLIKQMSELALLNKQWRIEKDNLKPKSLKPTTFVGRMAAAPKRTAAAYIARKELAGAPVLTKVTKVFRTLIEEEKNKIKPEEIESEITEAQKTLFVTLNASQAGSVTEESDNKVIAFIIRAMTADTKASARSAVTSVTSTAMAAANKVGSLFRGGEKPTPPSPEQQAASKLAAAVVKAKRGSSSGELDQSGISGPTNVTRDTIGGSDYNPLEGTISLKEAQRMQAEEAAAKRGPPPPPPPQRTAVPPPTPQKLKAAEAAEAAKQRHGGTWPAVPPAAKANLNPVAPAAVKSGGSPKQSELAAKLAAQRAKVDAADPDAPKPPTRPRAGS